MFLTGPAVVKDALGEDVTAAQLGGTRYTSATASATSSLPATPTPRSRARPARLSAEPPRPPAPDAGRAPGARDPPFTCPPRPRQVYDVRA